MSTKYLFLMGLLFSLLSACNNEVVKTSDTVSPPLDEPVYTVSDSTPSASSDSISSSALPASGPTLHAIIAADTDDETVGKSVEIDLENVGKLLLSIQDNTGLRLQTRSISGNELTRNKVIEALNQLSVGPNDVVIFYYSGHGVNLNKGSKWPALVFGGRFLDLDEVKARIKAKNPRFLMVFADACNNLVQVISSFRGTKGMPRAKNYRQLFLNYRGDIMASSSIPGQKSWGNNGDGGFFTQAFLNHFNEELASASTPSWQAIMERAKKPLPTYHSEQPFQHPQYEINIRRVEASLQASEASIHSSAIPPLAPAIKPPLILPPQIEAEKQSAEPLVADDDLSIQVLPSSPFHLGDTMRLKVRNGGREKGYLLVWDINSAGQITRIFPNQFEQKHALGAGKTKTIPENAFSGFGFTIVEPVGQSVLVALLVKKHQVQTVLSERFEGLSAPYADQALQRLRGQLKQKLGENGWLMNTLDYEIVD